MLKLEQIQEIAIYYFQHKVRSRCKFEKIIKIIEERDHYIFYAFFKCKKTHIVKIVKIDYYGTIL